MYSMYQITTMVDTTDNTVVMSVGSTIVFPQGDVLQIRKPHYEVIYCLDSMPFPLKVDWEKMAIVLPRVFTDRREINVQGV